MLKSWNYLEKIKDKIFLLCIFKGHLCDGLPIFKTCILIYTSFAFIAQIFQIIQAKYIKSFV